MIQRPDCGRYVFNNKVFEQPLHEIIAQHRGFKCSRVEDHVYALLGLTTTRAELDIRYSVTPWDLLISVWLFDGRPSWDRLHTVREIVGVRANEFAIHTRVDEWVKLVVVVRQSPKTFVKTLADRSQLDEQARQGYTWLYAYLHACDFRHDSKD
jgi:hypothetical protein